jgi:hypothetical protein
MKVYHIVRGRPIGETWEAYLERPELYRDPFDHCGTWIEEVELADLAARFVAHMEYVRNHFPEFDWPHELKLAVRLPRSDPIVQAKLDQDWEDYCKQDGLGRQE